MKNGRPRSAFATNTGAKNVHHCRRRLCHLLLLSPNNDEEEAHPTGSIPNQNRNRCVRRSLQSERTDSTAQVPCAAGRRPRIRMLLWMLLRNYCWLLHSCRWVVLLVGTTVLGAAAAAVVSITALVDVPPPQHGFHVPRESLQRGGARVVRVLFFLVMVVLVGHTADWVSR